GGRLLELRADVQRDQDQQHRGQERKPPSQGQEGAFGHQGQEEEDEGGQEGAGLDADEGQGRQESAALDRGVLGHQHGRPGLLGAGTEALGQTQDDQQDRREDPGLLVGGQHADQGRGAAHQDDRGHQYPTSADAVTEGAEEQTAEGAGGETDAVDAEGGDGGHGGVVRREEQPVEDQGRHQPVHREVEVLQGTAD